MRRGATSSEEQLKIMKSAILRQAIAEGRSPTHDWERVRKDREIQKTLDEFEAAGLKVRYHSCDVADWDQLAAVLDEIRAQDGPIEGIIHGAGFGKPLRFGTTAVDKLRRTVLPKVDGTLALMHLTQNDPLRHFIAFGSLSGRFGGNGLTDYAAANDMLAKLCGWFRRRRPGCLATCFHWQTWDQVGMALEAEALGITKNTFKMKLMPPNEGVAHLLAELAAGAPESEVLISDGYFERRFYPYDFEMPKALPESRGSADAAAEDGESGTTGPLISHWRPGSIARSGVAQIVFDPRTRSVPDPTSVEGPTILAGGRRDRGTGRGGQFGLEWRTHPRATKHSNYQWAGFSDGRYGHSGRGRNSGRQNAVLRTDQRTSRSAGARHRSGASSRRSVRAGSRRQHPNRRRSTRPFACGLVSEHLFG